LRESLFNEEVKRMMKSLYINLKVLRVMLPWPALIF
jgi:hypothetical protein